MKLPVSLSDCLPSLFSQFVRGWPTVQCRLLLLCHLPLAALIAPPSGSAHPAMFGSLAGRFASLLLTCAYGLRRSLLASGSLRLLPEGSGRVVVAEGEGAA